MEINWHRQGAAAGRAAPGWRNFPLRILIVITLAAAILPGVSLAQDTDYGSEETGAGTGTDTGTTPTTTPTTTTTTTTNPPKCLMVVVDVSASTCTSKCQAFKKCDGVIKGSPSCVSGPC